MGGAILPITFLGLHDIVTIFLQIVVGVAIYVFLSIVFKVDDYFYIWNTVKPFISRFIKKKSENNNLI